MKDKLKIGPKAVITELMGGNTRYAQEAHEGFKHMLDAQNPQITLVTCSDSRVSGNVFGRDPLNYVFHVRNIGNQIYSNPGSVDYGVMHLHTPVLMILGHTDCGAIKATLGDYSKETPEIKGELDTLANVFKIGFDDEDKHVKHLRYAQTNVDAQVAFAVDRYTSRIQDGSLVVVGAVLDIHGLHKANRGDLYIVNLNGMTAPDDILVSEALSGLEKKLRESRVKRI